MIGVFDKRAPFVRFEEQECGINSEASEKAGRPIPKVELMACITPSGSKDEVVKIASEWLTQIRNKAIRGEFPPDWVEIFTKQHEAHLKGHELPREGTPIRTWQMLTRDQQNRVLFNNITTVEDLELVPDGSLGNLGLDGRVMRDLARAWIAEGKDKGAVALELANANAKLLAQQEQIDKLTQRLDRAESKSRKSEAA